ncbi:Apoptosis inhibitor 5 [Acipenser ruthenus]|uniref:Apoptosis inhibitor 5 n=1 Tax=Acipenser ruthenus TaxID=7906 RepID=A0A662YWW4_ACIRT|nr:Apoptosis inhibitor 5 [Acipenser ruthenus]
MAATVEELYRNYGVLADAKDDVSQHKDAYQGILDGVKGGPKEKRLAAQFIPKFFKSFPELADAAINAQLDLCEDEDVSIRRQAIKELPQFATGENLPRIADILTQLLQSDDSAEFNLVNIALLSIFKMDAKGTLGGLFTQILQGEDIVRERAVKFLSSKMKTLPDEVMTKEVEDYIFTESKKVLEDVTGEEFVVFMKILSGLKNLQTVSGRQQLVQLVAEQAYLEQHLNPADADSVDRLLQCTRQAVPLFSKNVHSTRFVTYFCEHALPNLSTLTSPVAELDIQLEVLKLLAEMSPFCGDMEKLEVNLTKLFDKLLEYMPLPPEEAENGENSGSEEPKLQFSYVECLLFGFHQLGKKLPDFLTDKLNGERLKDFKIRLQYFARGLQVYIRQLRAALQGKTGVALKTDENKIKVVALKITNNINVLIKDLFHNPPSYKSTVTLSWKPVQKAEAAGQKRSTSEDTTSSSPPKKPTLLPKRDARQIYNPPSGKYSGNIGDFSYGVSFRFLLLVSSWRGKMANYRRRDFEPMFCFRFPGRVSGLGGALIFLSCVLAEPSAATTHWVVTEDGKIQQQVDSPLNLKHPHDLVIFMRQETRVSYLKELEKQLVAQKIHIEDNEDRDTGLEQRHYKEDLDCIKAKVPLGDLDLYDGTYISLESKDISPEDHVDHKSPLPLNLEKPNCTKVLELPYSIHAFQHLRGVQERVNLTTPLLSQEDSIFSCMSQRVGRSMEEMGHRIHEALHLNSSSWVLYNMAAFYWRMKNEPRQVVECAVRALHLSPRQHKDIALVNMANVLHRAHFSADAAILVHTALDITSDLLTSHYTLGNIYAMLGEYNHSVLCYDHALQAKPGFEQALKRKHAVLCQQKLEQKLETQHRSLQRTLNELKEYQKQHDQYLRQQEALDKHKLGQEEQILRNIIHETQMAKEAQLGNHQLCRLGKPQSSLHCPYDLPVRYHRGDVFESVELIQFGEDGSTASSTSLISELSLNQSEGRELFPSVSSPPSLGTFWGKEASSKDSQDILWPKRSDCAQIFPSIPTPEELPTYFLPPENRGLGTTTVLGAFNEVFGYSSVRRSLGELEGLLQNYHGKVCKSLWEDSQDILWPKRSDCAQIFPSIPTPEELPTYFLPPENRGLGVQALLFQGRLPEVLPPPTDCSSVPGPPLRDSSASLGWGLEGRELPDHHARLLLLSRLDRPSLSEEQIGGLITQGLNQSGAPLWLVLNEAALFWRASGNATSALSCLRRALNSAPQEHLDIPLVNAANLLLHYGLYQEASQVLERALSINRSEPLTLLSLGNVCLAQGNVSGAVSVFRQALSLGTRCPECESSLRLIRCLQFYPFLYNLSSSPACKREYNETGIHFIRTDSTQEQTGGRAWGRSPSETQEQTGGRAWGRSPSETQEQTGGRAWGRSPSETQEQTGGRAWGRSPSETQEQTGGRAWGRSPSETQEQTGGRAWGRSPSETQEQTGGRAWGRSPSETQEQTGGRAWHSLNPTLGPLTAPL